MTTLELLILALGLSMDAFAVTISNQVAFRGTDKLHKLLMPIFFGAFQAGMTLVGYFAGSLVSDFIEQYAGIVAFVILGFIGGKMIFDGVRDMREEEAVGQGKLTVPVLFFQAIATSIDALAVGVSFAALSIDVAFASSIIGVTTFICCFGALFLTRRFGEKLGSEATIFGGIVLIIIGVKALFG